MGPTFLPTLGVALALTISGCPDGDAATTPTTADAIADAAADVSSTLDITTAELPPWPPPQTTQDFIVTAITFYAPDDVPESDATVANPCGVDGVTKNATYTPLILDGLVVDGFDLDGVDGQGSSPCAHADYMSPSGTPGVDNGFLHVMDMVRPARPGQTIETVLASAPSQGLVKIGIRLSGVDDLDNDDDVQLLVTTIADTPLLGADGNILAGGSVAADNTPEYQSVLNGRIVDGVMEAGPGDISIGKINLLVVENRVVTLRDARVRAVVSGIPTGGLAVDAIMAGWWQRDDMVEAIGQAILAIGANPGELECVLDQHLDHALDGQTCDAMSTMIRVKAVSGFITGLDSSLGGER